MLDSIRLRLTLWYVAVLALVLTAFAAATYVLVVRALDHQTDENLAEMARNFQIAVRSELDEKPDEKAVESEIANNIAESNFHDYIFVAAKAERIISSTAGDEKTNAELLQMNSDAAARTLRIGGENFRARRFQMNFAGANYDLLIARSLGEQHGFLVRLRSIFFAAVPLALLLAGVGGYFLARKSLAPVAAMSRQASNIGATNLHERLPVMNKRDELGSLAAAFNELLARLENSFEQQRRFMADASHELRTPLAIVRGESEVALAVKTRPNEELRESLAIVHDESKRLTRIVEDLFTLARADAGQYKIADEKIYLDELVAECVRAVQVLAEKRRIAFEMEIAGEMPLRGDEQLLRRLFINLLDNAIKYNRDGGKIFVRAQIGDGEYRVTIADTGTGISAAEKGKIFERFYRSDKARSRTTETETSGAGLGLSIAQWIAEIHRGRVELTSSDDSGSVFTAIFPLAK